MLICQFDISHREWLYAVYTYSQWGTVKGGKEILRVFEADVNYLEIAYEIAFPAVEAAFNCKRGGAQTGHCMWNDGLADGFDIS